jgi:hypothetical protein
MKAIVSLVLALASTIALAQSPPSSTSPPPSSDREPSSSLRNPSTDGTANYSEGSGDDKLQMKSCLAKVKADNPQMSQEQIQRRCEKLKPKDGGH